MPKCIEMCPLAGVNHLTKFGENQLITRRNASNWHKMHPSSHC